MPTFMQVAVGLATLTGSIAVARPHPAFAGSDQTMTPAESRQLALDELTVMDDRELALTREICANGNASPMLGKLAAKWGSPEAVPTPGEYCGAALRAAVRQGSTLRLFQNLALQQLGLGNELAFADQKEKLGQKPAELIANIRAAADGGYLNFIDAAGKERPLACPLALEAGAAWAGIHGDQVDRPGITEELAGKIVGVCFNPAITEVNISATGQKLTVQQAGVAAGEVLARSTRD